MFKKQRTYYEILGVSRTSTHAEVKSAYYRKAKQFHPDVARQSNKDSAEFVELTAAYQTLGNVQKRELYDMNIDMGGATPEAGSGEGPWSGFPGMDMSHDDYVKMSRDFEARQRAAQDKDPEAFWSRNDSSVFSTFERFFRRMENSEMEDLYGAEQQRRYLKSLKSRMPPVFGLREEWQSFLFSEKQAMSMAVKVSTTVDGELGQIFHAREPVDVGEPRLRRDVDDVLEYWLEGERSIHAVRVRSSHNKDLDIVTLYDDKDKRSITARVELPVVSDRNPMARVSRQHFVLDRRGRQVLAGIRTALFGTRYLWVNENGDEVARATRSWWNLKHRWRIEVYDREVAHPAVFAFIVGYDTLDTRRRIDIGKKIEPAVEWVANKMQSRMEKWREAADQRRTSQQGN